MGRLLRLYSQQSAVPRVQATAVLVYELVQAKFINIERRKFTPFLEMPSDLLHRRVL